MALIVKTLLNFSFLIECIFVSQFAVVLARSLLRLKSGSKGCSSISSNDTFSFRQRRQIQVMEKQEKDDSCIAAHTALSARAGNMLVVLHHRSVTFV